MEIDIFQLPAALRKRWYVVAAAIVLCLGLGMAYAVLHKPTFSASADILVDQQSVSNDGSEVSLWGASPNQANQEEAILDSQIYVLRSRDILAQVVKNLELTKDASFNNIARNGTGDNAVAPTVTALQNAVSVTRSGQSFILTVSVKHGNAERAADIANAIARVYLASAQTSRNEATRRAANAFQAQAMELQDRVFKAEAELERFKAAAGLVSTGQQGLLIDQQVEGASRQLIAARGDFEQKRATYEQVRGLTLAAIEAGAIPETLQSGTMGILRQKYADAKSRETELATALGAAHPQMKAARSQVASIRQTLEQEVQRLRQSMKSAYERSQSNLKGISAQLEGLKKTSLDSSESGIRAKQMQSEVEALRALYKTFLTRAEQFGQRDMSATNNSRIISPAIAIASSSMTMKLMVLVAAGLFGTAIGSFAAVALEMFSPGSLFRGAGSNPLAPDEARRLPVIASVPLRTRPKKGLLDRLVKARAGAPVEDTENGRRMQLALSRTVETLIRTRPQDGPATILFLSADDQGNRTSIIPDIAQALHQMEKDVLFSNGEPGPAIQEHRTGDATGGLGNKLAFVHLSQSGRARPGRGAPTYANFRDRSRPADFIIIDGTGQEARNHLPELLRSAHAIVLVANDDGDRSKLEDLVEALSPWQDQMLGTIMIGEAA
jgi:uncharacterized protein involved in exopolysaccharide biosynthesis